MGNEPGALARSSRRLLSGGLNVAPAAPLLLGGTTPVNTAAHDALPMTHPSNAHETSQGPAEHDLSSPAPTAVPAAAPAAVPPPRERRLLVMVTIALATLLFLAASGLLYLRWATMREPTCIFIVEAPTSLRGAEVTVDGVKLFEPHTVTIGRGERFAIPFYLDYGIYNVRVTLNGATVMTTEVDLRREAPYQKIDLSRFPPPLTTTTPTTSISSASALPGEGR